METYIFVIYTSIHLGETADNCKSIFPAPALDTWCYPVENIDLINYTFRKRKLDSFNMINRKRRRKHIALYPTKGRLQFHISAIKEIPQSTAKHL